MNSKGRASSVARGVKLIALLALVAMILVAASGCATPARGDGARGEGPESGGPGNRGGDPKTMQDPVHGDGSGADLVLKLINNGEPVYPGLPFEIRNDYFNRKVKVWVLGSDGNKVLAKYVRYKIQPLSGPLVYNVALNTTQSADFEPKITGNGAQQPLFEACDYTKTPPHADDCSYSGFPSVIFGRLVPQVVNGTETNLIAKLSSSNSEIRVTNFCLEPEGANTDCDAYWKQSTKK